MSTEDKCPTETGAPKADSDPSPEAEGAEPKPEPLAASKASAPPARSGRPRLKSHAFPAKIRPNRSGARIGQPEIDEPVPNKQGSSPPKKKAEP